MARLPGWLRRVGRYGLALLFVAVAAVLRWALSDALSPTPFLVFYLAWVGAAVFGGLGPGLLATVASWLCVDVLFDTTPGQVGLTDLMSVARLIILLAGGLAVSLVGEKMRRTRLHERRQGRKLAELAQLANLAPLLILDSQDRIVSWSDGCAKLYGFTTEQAIGRISHELLRTEFPQPLETIQAILHETGRWEGELTHRRADGTVVNVASLWVLRDGASNPAVLEVNNDITERKQAETAAKEAKKSLEREKGILQSVMSGAKNSHLVYLDRDFNFVRVNETYAKTCGYTPEEMVGKNHFALYPDAENEVIFSRVRDTGVPVEVHDKPFVFPDQPERGTTYWDWTLTPIKNDSAYVEGLVFSLFETTQRKQAEEALRESEERTRQRAAELATVLEAVPTPVIIVHDPDGVHMTGNQAADELLRRPRGAEISLSAPAETRPRHFKAVKDGRELRTDELPAQRAARGLQVQDFEFSLVFDDGTTRSLVGYGTPLRDDKGRPRGAVHVLVDITERKRAEEALRESEEKYRRIVETATEGIALVDANGRIVFANDRWSEIHGYRPEEDRHVTLFDLVFPEDMAEMTERWESRKRGVGENYEFRFRRKDGSAVWTLIGVAPRFDPEGGFLGTLVMATDITERKRAEEALRELNATLESRVAQRTAELEDRARQLQRLTLDLSEAESRERKRLAGILHDDLQQVLAAAKFHLALVSNRYKDDETLQEMTGGVEELLVEAIGKSRNLSRELSPPGLAHSDLQETFEWLAGQMQTKHGLTVHVDVRDQIVLQSEPLKALLYKAAQEMLFNVVKHAQVREARVHLRRRRGSICLAVFDKGRGFDPQGPEGTTGSGLLSIRERVNLLGGHMKVRSAKAKGSTFLIVVPDSAQQTNQTDHA